MSTPTPFDELVAVMARLRGPDGCPWDREQTHASLRPYLLEEAYEALEAMDGGDPQELCGELGDVLLQVVFHAQIASEEGRFDAADVCRAIVDKLVHRHPHVFGDVAADTPDQVLSNWEQLKRQEKSDAAAPHSVLDGVPAALPALLRAHRVQSRAARAGFDWDEADGPLDKVEEEFTELRQAWSQEQTDEVEEELGDLLFALVNVARFMQLNPEDALRRAVAKFERRFRAVERHFQDQGQDLEEVSLAAMDRVWDRVKAAEAPHSPPSATPADSTDTRS